MIRAEDCIFCNIIERHAPADIVYQDQHSIAFLDIYPLNPGHTLVVSKKHYATLDEMPPEEVGLLFATVAKVMKGVKEAVGADGINIGQSNGKAASQEVFHVHVHIIPRFSQESPGGDTFRIERSLGRKRWRSSAGRSNPRFRRDPRGFSDSVRFLGTKIGYEEVTIGL